MDSLAFKFKLTVPNDPHLAAIVADVARHAAEYAKLDAAAVDGFVSRARDAAAKALKSAPGHSCLMVFTAADGTLSVTIGSETISQPLS
jgi:hypothetical protein